MVVQFTSDQFTIFKNAMLRIKLVTILLALCLLLPYTLAHSQVGHPAKGSWSGTLESDSGDSSRIRLLIDDHNGKLSGVVNPGRNSADMDSVELDAATWQLKIVADTANGSLTLDGTLSNLGSWTNRKYRGNYTLGDQSGSFEITLN